MATLEDIVCVAMSPITIFIPVKTITAIRSYMNSINKGLKDARNVKKVYDKATELYDTTSGIAHQIAKLCDEDKCGNNLSGFTFMMKAAKPYMKSFLDDQTDIADFKEFYSFTAVAFMKITDYVKNNKPSVRAMNICALEGIGLEYFLKSFEPTPKIKHHYELLSDLVDDAKKVLRKKKEDYEQMIKADIDRTYFSMLVDKLRGRFTYYDHNQKKCLVVEEMVDSKIGKEERHKILKDYIDTKYVSETLKNKMNSVIDFTSDVQEEIAQQRETEDLSVDIINHED